ncbi:MAG: type II toxin-antitoxin system VapC family toxin [Blastocatellia bacterium]
MNDRRKTKSSSASVVKPLAFWDSSALVPLVCFQSQSASARQAARLHAQQIVWWGTSVEITSAIHRLNREGYLTATEVKQSLQALDHMRRKWGEIQPSSELREYAEHLLGRRKLRAADALQLATALVWCDGKPRNHRFIVADGDLAVAAEAEMFDVIRLS